MWWQFEKTWKKRTSDPKIWLQQVENGSYMKPTAPYVLTYEEKKTFLQIIKQLKIPTHYTYALRKKVARDGKLRGLKSHDYYIMMQHVMSLCHCRLMQRKYACL